MIKDGQLPDGLIIVLLLRELPIVDFLNLFDVRVEGILLQLLHQVLINS